jgi:hypothetical protein
MWLRRGVYAFGLASVLALWGCGRSSGPDFVSKPEPWRAEEEMRCLTSGQVRPNPFVVQRAALGGPGYCGAAHPFEMSAALDGRVQLKPTAMLRCGMIPAVDHWVQTTVMPAALRYYGLPVIEIKVAASYGCRPMNNVPGAKLSEHGHANALDVAGFRLADGRWVQVKQGWLGDARERTFLRLVHDRSCQTFTTVLGPNYDANHRDHLHMDLAWHGRDGQMKICK